MTGVAGFAIFANNLPGVTKVEIKNGAGTVVATKSLTFTDTTIAKITATVLKPLVNGDGAAAHTNDVIKLVFTDSAGAVIKAPAAYPTAASGLATTGGISQANACSYDTATATAGCVATAGALRGAM
jgi:hypothetical protein